MSERGVNSVTLLGRVGRDPETRHSQNGTAFANFSLALGERRKKGEEYEDFTEWVNCVAIGKTAETVDQHVTKGSRLYVTGKIQTRKWEDKEGTTRYSTEVLLRDLVFLGEGKGQGQASPKPRQEPGEDFDEAGFDPNDDVPF